MNVLDTRALKSWNKKWLKSIFEQCFIHINMMMCVCVCVVRIIFCDLEKKTCLATLNCIRLPFSSYVYVWCVSSENIKRRETRMSCLTIGPLIVIFFIRSSFLSFYFLLHLLQLFVLIENDGMKGATLQFKSFGYLKSI